jgi:hypothetical protein
MTDAAIVADTPVPQPPTTSDRVKAFIGDLARPFAIIVTSFSAAWATVVVAYKVTSGEGGALVLGAAYAGVAGLYGWKAWESNTQAKQTAQVEIAKATTEVK